jgi:hypothetical protein
MTRNAARGLRNRWLILPSLFQVFGRQDYGLTTDCGGRRPKSAKARNRGGRAASRRKGLLFFCDAEMTQLALSFSYCGAATCLEFGEDRKSPAGQQTDANDPLPTFATAIDSLVIEP